MYSRRFPSSVNAERSNLAASPRRNPDHLSSSSMAVALCRRHFLSEASGLYLVTAFITCVNCSFVSGNVGELGTLIGDSREARLSAVHLCRTQYRKNDRNRSGRFRRVIAAPAHSLR